MNREYFLEEAKKCVCGGRDQDYGKPEDNFGQIAMFWKDYLDVEIRPEQVPVMMALMKIARVKRNPTQEDSYIDAIGYLACAGEIATKEKRKPNCELY